MLQLVALVPHIDDLAIGAMQTLPHRALLYLLPSHRSCVIMGTACGVTVRCSISYHHTLHCHTPCMHRLQGLVVPSGTASCLHRSSNLVLAFRPLFENPSWEGRVRAL